MTDNARLFLISRGFELLKEIIRAAILISGFYFAYLAIAELAGKQTEALLAFHYFISRDNDYALPWIISFASLLYAGMQRRLRLKKTQEMQGYIQELELKIDPNRTSSGLTTTGQTPAGGI